MAEDKDYLADAQKVELPVGSPIDGAQISKMIGALAAATTPEDVAQFSRLSATLDTLSGFYATLADVSRAIVGFRDQGNSSAKIRREINATMRKTAEIPTGAGTNGYSRIKRQARARQVCSPGSMPLLMPTRSRKAIGTANMIKSYMKM